MKTSSHIRETQPPKITRREQFSARGFALVATLSVMSLLIMVAIAMLSLSSVSVRKADHELPRAEAMANARMALGIALAQLQETAGLDQRVTAKADILTGGNEASPDRANWTGVWDSSDYDPSNPTDKTFVRWLVSEPSSGSTSDIELASDSPSGDDIVLFEGVNDSNSVSVPKVTIKDSGSETGAYAYWVEDEGVKADLSWYEGEYSDDERKQSARLSAAAGVDYEILQGPFSGNVSYPIELDSSNSWLEDIEKAHSPADMPLVMGSGSAEHEWLKTYRHDMTVRSRGVMSDVKNGGLRRDLSLAFEMDGKADISASEQPTKFNKQVGEFVGGSDNFAAIEEDAGMPAARYLWREASSIASTPFAQDIQTSESVFRGPTWWALRDYATLYKRLSKNGSEFSLPARAYYPNASSGSDTYKDIFLQNGGSYRAWDRETVTAGSELKHSPKPARANYSPVYLGSVALISALDHNGNLALAIDPIFYIWNPYNTKLTFENMAVISPSYSYPGIVSLWVTSGGTEVQYGPYSLREWLARNAGAGSTSAARNEGISYLLNGPITMDPGEVLVFTAEPTSGTGVTRGSASPGLSEKNVDESGIIMTLLPTPTGWATVPYDASIDRVDFNFVITAPNNTDLATEDKYANISSKNVSGSSRYTIISALPGSSITSPADLEPGVPGNSSYPSNYGEELQFAIHNFAAESKTGVDGYTSSSTEQDNINTGILDDNGMSPVSLAGKQFFGLFGLLRKPASYGFDPVGNAIDSQPVEAFSMLNPLPTLYSTDLWAASDINQLYLMVSSSSSNDLTNGYGINFPSGTNGNWGESYSSTGSTHVPMLDIPSGPLYSLASFSHANLGLIGGDPARMVGFSRPNAYVNPGSIFAELNLPGSNSASAQDSAWLANDALFDRYYLSGLAPEFTIGSGGYSANGTLSDTLTKFYSSKHETAEANPVLKPYLPPGKTAADVIGELDQEDGYRKMGAYSLIEGAFNINSTSVTAWEAFLRGNRGLTVQFSDGSSESSSETPFPSGMTPVSTTGAQALWSEFSRLSDSDINNLATEIVDQVKLRGPFMSLSDFVNRRVSSTVNSDTHYSGALQAAIDKTTINDDVKNGAGGVTPSYASEVTQDVPAYLNGRMTTSGIATEINQQELLLPLAPRMTARTDTFRIRAYGEALSNDGTTVLAKAMCEVVVQRVPEYLDDEDEPWDESPNALNATASADYPLDKKINETYGRRFNAVSFRWLHSDEF